MLQRLLESINAAHRHVATHLGRTYGQQLQSFDNVIAKETIETPLDEQNVEKRFFGEGVPQIFSHNLPAVARDVVNNDKGNVGKEIEDAEREPRQKLYCSVENFIEDVVHCRTGWVVR